MGSMICVFALCTGALMIEKESYQCLNWKHGTLVGSPYLDIVGLLGRAMSQTVLSWLNGMDIVEGGIIFSQVNHLPFFNKIFQLIIFLFLFS